jgi:ABC-type nitrate/sulfonate/bicarbonate transport system permease component
VFEAQHLFDTSEMHAAILTADSLGRGLNNFFLLIEKNFVHWSGK